MVLTVVSALVAPAYGRSGASSVGHVVWSPHHAWPVHLTPSLSQRSIVCSETSIQGRRRLQSLSCLLTGRAGSRHYRPRRLSILLHTCANGRQSPWPKVLKTWLPVASSSSAGLSSFLPRSQTSCPGAASSSRASRCGSAATWKSCLHASRSRCVRRQQHRDMLPAQPAGAAGPEHLPEKVRIQRLCRH